MTDISVSNSFNCLSEEQYPQDIICSGNGLLFLFTDTHITSNNVPLERKERIKAIIEEDEAYEYALETALEWWIKNTLEASWKELISVVYMCRDNDAADAMRKKIGE